MAAIAASTVTACAPDTKPGSLLAGTRVLGAQVVAGGDRGRTWPRPGETATITWLLAGPTPRPLAWSFALMACRAGDDDATCRAAAVPVAPAPPDTGSGTSDGTTPPVVTVTAPVSAAGEAPFDRLLIDGVICAGGPVADRAAAVWARCATMATDAVGPVAETDVQVTVFIQTGDAGNAPPTAGDDIITWEGTTWTGGADDASLTDAGGPCRDQAGVMALPLDDKERHVTLVTDAADREVIGAGTTAASPPLREGLQVSAFTTAGAFDTQFAAVLAADASPTTAVAFKWQPPAKGDVAAQLGTDGRLVRFVFVLRDGRGGLDVSTRSLCLLPESNGAPP